MDRTILSYGRQTIDEADIAEVVEVLKSDWLTTGPKVAEFERSFADFLGAGHAVSVSSGTAALHCTMFALGIGPGDEVIVPPMTFTATANCIVYQGGTPVFVDVDPETLLIDPDQIEPRITSKTKAIIGVDYAGQPCDWDALRDIATRYELALVADSCHALGAEYKGKKAGTLADMTVFSFHPVKHITTGEGGMITTDNPDLAERMRIFRNHGITTDHRQREKQGSWLYEMVTLGYNYRLTDFQCALGMSQLKKLPEWLASRRKIAANYDEAFSHMQGIKPVGLRSDLLSANKPVCDHTSDTSIMYGALRPPPSLHAYHLFVVRVEPKGLNTFRDHMFEALRAAGIGAGVHYIPVHLHPFYKTRFGTRPGLCPVAEAAYEGILSLPIFPAMSDQNVKWVAAAVSKALENQQ